MSKILTSILDDPTLGLAILIVDALDEYSTATQRVVLRLELNEDSISNTIRLSRLKKYTTKTRDVVHQHLTENLSNTFLWLLKVLSMKTLTTLKTFPPGLGSLYDRMMKDIHSSDESELSREVLAVVSVVYRPITLQELASTIDPLADIEDVHHLEQIVASCGSFLTLREDSIYFVHQSAKDFLLGEGLEASIDMSHSPSPDPLAPIRYSYTY
ncbi:heterokaryon incompatibility protein [Plectosphaerella plurivora]|uniref:Heterokaryon incompatibility protein n=1 Tax=Plectosphaerella plurivora TaxID=936078 RepID=A0A9P9A4R8_9PEZI|nr:heterokaryon incompatibility protein [Plectosphaerella plurivora]